MSGALEQKLAAVKPPLPRTVHMFDIPDSVPGEVRQVAVKELTAQEELTALKRAGSDIGRIAVERVKESIVEVNGEKVSLHDGSADKVWAGLHPIVRDLISSAYLEIHQPKEETTALFLRSRKVRVG
jgi:hypothetical protein